MVKSFTERKRIRKNFGRVTEIAANSEKCKLNYGNLTQSNYKNMTKLQAFQNLRKSQNYQTFCKYRCC